MAHNGDIENGAAGAGDDGRPPFTNDYFNNQWSDLLDRCALRSKMHARTRALWALIFYIIGIGGLVINNIVMAEGVGEILATNTITYYGIAGAIVVGLQLLINPGAAFREHGSAVKNFRKIYYDIKKCETLPDFLDLQNTFTQTEFTAPTIPFFFWKTRMERAVMNPHLQRQVNEYFRYSRRSMESPVEHDVEMVMADRQHSPLTPVRDAQPSLHNASPAPPPPPVEDTDSGEH